MPKPAKPTVLLVEDSPVQQRLIKEAFKAAGYAASFTVEPDAERAWDVVQELRERPRARWPAFAIIDIGLPGMSGIELLDRIRQEPSFREWPLVVFTASKDPDDRAEAGMAAATAYFTKPTGTTGYNAVAREILDLLGSRIGWTPTPAGPAMRRRVW